MVERIEFQDCEILSNVPSKAFYDVEVLHTLLVSNLRFREVHSRAFSFKCKYKIYNLITVYFLLLFYLFFYAVISKLIIANSYFDSVDAEWLEVHLKESSIIRDNYFGNTSQIAFKGKHVKILQNES